MSTKEAEANGNMEQTTYQTANGQSNDLGRQVSITLTPQQFEEMYFQPNVRSRAQLGLVKTFGNPTSFGIVSFLLTLMPTSICLMGWRGATANSLVALIGVYYFHGGMALYVAGLLEFVIGNTFPGLVFSSFGTFWLSLGIFLDPTKQIQTTILTPDNPEVYYLPWGYYLIMWGVYVFFLTFASFKTNVVLVWILFFVSLTFTLLGVGYIRLAENSAAASNIIVASGACGFVACLGGYYILLHLCLASTEFPFNIPLFDLSHFWSKK